MHASVSLFQCYSEKIAGVEFLYSSALTSAKPNSDKIHMVCSIIQFYSGAE